MMELTTKEKANILVMGNSGAGKSTLINAIFRFDKAAVGDGPSVTKEMAVYENDDVAFRAIDTRGLEYGFLAQMNTKNAIHKWSRESVKKGDKERYIHAIWYCIEATSKRVFGKNLDTLKSVSKMWKGIPIIIVLTKSYSETEIQGNVSMIRSVLEQNRGKSALNVVDILPVVARPFPVNQDIIIPPYGLEQLVERTNGIIPEALQINKKAVGEFEFQIKRGNAMALTAAATTTAAIVGAVPIPIADSLVLMPLQTGMVLGIEKIYGGKKDDDNMKKITELIVQSGAVTVAAHALISGIKAIPGINLAASLLNAVVAGVITAIIGEVTLTVMEKIERGELSPDDLEWIKKYAEDMVTNGVGTYMDKLGKGLNGKDAKGIGSLIVKIFKEVAGSKNSKK